MPFFKMYGQADRTSLAVYVLREGSHVVHGRTDPSLMEYREGSDVVLDWHCKWTDRGLSSPMTKRERDPVDV